MALLSSTSDEDAIMYVKYNDNEIDELIKAGVRPKAKIQHFDKDKAGLKVADFKSLSKYCQAKSYNSGSVLFYEGDEGESAFLIIQGIVHIASEDAKPKSVTIGELVGDFAINGKIVRNSTATFITKGVALVIGQNELEEISSANPPLGFKFVQNFMNNIKIGEQNLIPKDLDEEEII